MSPDQAYKYGNQLLASGQEDQAIKVYKFIGDFHSEHETAPWALFLMARIIGKRGEISDSIAQLEEIMAEYPNSPAVTRGDVPLLLTSYLIFHVSDYEAAKEIAKSALDKHSAEMGDRNRAQLVGRLALAYIKLGDNAAAEELLTSQLPTCARLLTSMAYYDYMAQIRIAKKDFDGALSIARTGYALCNFNEVEIKQMANLVRRVFVAKGEFAKGTQFLAAQEDAEKPNPLKDVPMPTVAAELKQQLLQAAGKDPALLCHVCLYTGDNETALEHAMAYMAEASAADAVRSLMEVARVFKAADLNLVRANQFINYAKTGEGENPLADGTL